MQAYGKSRDLKVLEGLDGFRYMTTNQIAELYFQSIKRQDFRIKKTSERMKRMFDRGYVQRFRFPSEPYIFTTGGNKYNRQIQHYLMIVDCWIALNNLRPSGAVLNYRVEVKQENVQTDLVIEYTNNFRGEKKLYWIEVENESTGDILDKVVKYEGLKWTCENDGLPVGSLVLVYKKHSSVKRLEAYTGELEIKSIHINELTEKWRW